MPITWFSKNMAVQILKYTFQYLFKLTLPPSLSIPFSLFLSHSHAHTQTHTYNTIKDRIKYCVIVYNSNLNKMSICWTLRTLTGAEAEDTKGGRRGLDTSLVPTSHFRWRATQRNSETITQILIRYHACTKHNSWSSRMVSAARRPHSYHTQWMTWTHTFGKEILFC